MRYKLLLVFLCISGALFAQEPAGTYLFAERDGQELSLDIYCPVPGSPTTLDGIAKPTILYVFGGGFVTGRRGSREARSWPLRRLCIWRVPPRAR